MEEKCISVNKDKAVKMMDELIEEYRMSEKSLSRVLGVDKRIIENRHKASFTLPDSPDKYRSFLNRLLMLRFLPDDSPDLRVRAFLEVLLREHRMSAASVARISGLTEQDVLAFLRQDEGVSAETKYRIASAVMVLRFLFQAAEPEL